MREANKDRFLRALRRRPSDEVPFFETEFSPKITSAILGRQVQVRSHALPVDEYVDLLQRTGIDMAYIGVGWPVGRKETMDAEGRPYFIDGLIRDRSDLKEVVPPSLDPIRKRIESFLEAARRTHLGWTYPLPSSWGIESAVGYENFYAKIYEDPEFIEEFMDRYEEYSLPVTELVLEYAPDAVVLAAGTCYKSGLVMSMEKIEDLVIRRMKEQLRPIHEKGVPVILHSDGDNSMMMDKWIELGIAGFHPVEPSATFDIYEVKRRWGDRIALLGNIDVAGVLSTGTPEEVATDTREHIERLGPGGGYICGSSHDIVDSIPLENLKAMIETTAAVRVSRP